MSPAISRDVNEQRFPSDQAAQIKVVPGVGIHQIQNQMLAWNYRFEKEIFVAELDVNKASIVNGLCSMWFHKSASL